LNYLNKTSLLSRQEKAWLKIDQVSCKAPH
jgi:hypothetical protein